MSSPQRLSRYITAYHTVSYKLIPTTGCRIIINFEVRSNILTLLSSNRARYSSTTVKFLEICRLSKGRVVRGARDFATLLVTCIATRVVIVKPTSSHFHQALLLFY